MSPEPRSATNREPTSTAGLLPGLVATSEQGSGTVAAVGLTCVMCSILLGGLTVGGVVAAAHRAASAADLAALAGAQSLAGGADAALACARVRSLAAAHGAELRTCEAQAEEMLVSVAVAVRAGPLVSGPALARARAGPAPGT